MVDWVGGKNAHLGEAMKIGLPIPAGFAITTRAYADFLAFNDLVDEINKQKMEIDPANPQTVKQVSDDIQALISAAQVPPALSEAILAAYARMQAEVGESSVRVSMRSSAIGEDSELSFAGQYLTILNVPGDQLLPAYKEILASLYTPRAISYRLNKGIRDEDIAMSVVCLQMVDAVASGVMYSHHPFNVRDDNLLISAVWGLGPYAVDGVITPDTYRVAKTEDFPILDRTVSHKAVQLVAKPEAGLHEIPVPPELQDQPCLSPEQIKVLAAYGVKLEEHYHCPQDVEWALDKAGRLMVLQSRPLVLQAPTGKELQDIPAVTGYPVLVEGGAAAFPGVGCGPAFLVQGDEDLLNFPDGAVLVARHSSPKFVMVMAKAQAIVTDSGSISGHMASLSREFSLPTLLDTKVATQTIAPGQIVTVDAYTCRIYQGQVPELLDHQPARESHLKDTPVYETLKQVAEFILPLHLVDPRSPEFSPDFCRSLHDLGTAGARILLHRDVQDQRPGLRPGGVRREAGRRHPPGPLPHRPGRRLDGGRSPRPQGNPGPGGLGPPPGRLAGDAPRGRAGSGTPPRSTLRPVVGDAGTDAGRPQCGGTLRRPQLRHHLRQISQFLFPGGLPLQRPGRLLRRHRQQELHHLLLQGRRRRRRAPQPPGPGHRHRPHGPGFFRGGQGRPGGRPPAKIREPRSSRKSSTSSAACSSSPARWICS